MASAEGSKSANSVKLHDKLDISDCGIGENLVSSNADVRAYVDRPVDRGSASNVPIQPRRLLLPERETVFHVTNNGYVDVSKSRDAYVGFVDATEVEDVKVEGSCD